MDGTAAEMALDALHSAVDGLLAAGLAPVGSAALPSLLSELEVQRRRLEAVDQALLAEIDQRGVAGEYARCSTAELLVTRLRVSPGEAKARVARARDLGPRRGLGGEPLSPILPVVAEASAAGEISAAHVDVITDCIGHISGVIAAEVAPVAERFLVEAARHEHPRALARTGQLLLLRLDPDGAEPRDAQTERRREFSLIKGRDGSSRPRGLLTAECTAAWEAIFDALAAPVPAADGMPDERSPAQRRHDALAEAAARLLRSGTMPPAGGSPVTIIATTTMSELGQGLGVAITGHGDPISIQQLLDMAGEAEIVPVIFNEAGGILAYGRGRRLASRGQRIALAARDGGCSFPGCDRPAAWTEVHHVRSWLDGGDTDLDNMCLLCRYHHREFAGRGWDVIMQDGIPHWLPPPWIDPDRRPIRNTAHHLRDFDFAA